ncbi:hypothetical protein [Psychrobacter sp. I-STPA6b]|uniref:hypothetical protein n=1 Tax=Psychrobacter sp. I-STPA6b TaxID=2585718 RepID=UPI001D0C92F6|nr:hypothetical protein [Psychrobacter sp. I-STPA6b]
MRASVNNKHSEKYGKKHPSALISLFVSLFIFLLSLSLPAMSVHADTQAFQAEHIEPSAQHTQPDTDIKSIHQEISETQAQSVRQQLQEIITSDDYATSKKYKTWQRKQKPEEIDTEDSWLVKLLKSLFEHTDSSHLQLMAAIIKTLLIAALILLIVWIIYHAQKNGWFNAVLPKQLHTASVSKKKNISLQQQLGELPPHQHLGIEAQRLLEAGQLEDAASILYRGSLRWLADNHLLAIVPATTERQCIKQLRQINQSIQHKNVTTETTHYINQVIQCWMQVAYDTPYLLIHSDQLGLQLKGLADEWLSMLPLSTSQTVSITKKGV